MSKPTITITSDTLPRIADDILQRLEATEFKLTKNGILEAMAKCIGGDRQNWGGIKHSQNFVGLGVSIPMDQQAEHSKAPSEDECAQRESTFIPAFAAIETTHDCPKNSPIAKNFGNVEVTERELYNLKKAYDFYRGKTEVWNREFTECLYDLIRPTMHGGLSGSYAYYNTTELLDVLTYPADFASAEKRVWCIMNAWAAHRIEGARDVDNPLGPILAYIEEQEKVGWEGERFKKDRWWNVDE